MRNTSQTFPVIARRLIDGMEIRFESEADAAEFMNIPKSSIRDCVNGKQTQTHGFEWSKDNRRAERTCHYVYDREICAWRCSECGGLEPVGDHVSYCPDCGARIEEEVDE